MTLATRHGATAPDQPVLVIGLEGWIDAGFAAATAMATLLEHIETVPFATFNADELVDHRARRPRLRVDDGLRGPITFAEPQLVVGTDRLGAGVVFLIGPEPDYRWRAFSAEVAATALEVGVRLVVGLGAFPTGAPHTRPVRLAATASDGALSRQIGFVPGSLDVPAGIGDVLAAACADEGIPSVSLWARVPHYVAGMPFPPAALALLDGLASLSGLVVDTNDLRESAEASRRRVDELIAESDEHKDMVRQLESQVDGGIDGEIAGLDELPESELPSGEELAAELERYLRGEA